MNRTKRSRERDLGDPYHYFSRGYLSISSPRGYARLSRYSCSDHGTVNGDGIGCADHTPSMLNVLLLVVHRTLLVLRGRALEVYLAAYLRCH